MQKTRGQVSPIHIFKSVQEYIEKINTAPLTPSIVKINKDQANELGNEEGLGFPFANIDVGFPESDDQLLFSLEFSEEGVGIGFSGGEGTWVAYESVGKTNEEVSTTLIHLITAFSNGQLKVLLTCLEENEFIQAIEILYRAPGRATYDAVATFEMFLPTRKLKNHTLITSLFANKSDIQDVEMSVSKIQKLLIPDADPSIMNAIGRKRLLDLSEPLTPELLKLKIDRYAEKIGKRASVKIDKKFDEMEASMGIYGMTLWEQCVHFARWRHIELMIWGFAMLSAHYWITWTIPQANPVILLIGVALLPLFLFRKRYPYPQVLYVLAPIGYVLFTIGAMVFLQYFTSHWLTWIIAVFAVMSIGENVFFDLYFIRQKIFDKLLHWAKK